MDLLIFFRKILLESKQDDIQPIKKWSQMIELFNCQILKPYECIMNIESVVCQK